MLRSTFRRRTALISACAAFLAAGSQLIASPLAGAATPAATVAADQGLSGVEAPMGTTNGDVEALAVSNGVLYAGGKFTTATSTSGSAVTRTYLAAFSTSTGALASSFNFTLNGDVEALSVSPDGKTLYFGGSFTTVNGATHNRIAAVDLTTNTLKSWTPNLNNVVTALYASNTNVYVGGGFSKVNNVTQGYFVSLDPSSAAISSGWTGNADARIYAITPTPDNASLLVGGAFNTLSGTTEHGTGKVDITTGSTSGQVWSSQATLPNTPDTTGTGFGGCTSTGMDIVISGNAAYIAGQGKQGGCYDGDLAVNWTDGTLIWNNECEGATQTLAVIGGVLYKGSHMHDCGYNTGGDGGGFTGAWDPTKRTFYHLSAQNLTNGNFVHWGPVTDSVDGPLAIATDGTQLFTGGEWTQVNKKAQAHLARFAPLTSTNNAAPTTPTKPTAVASGSGKVTVTWQGTTDVDNGVITYRLYRSSTLISTQSGESWPWTQPTFRFTDTGQKAGSSVTYSVTASDGTNTTAKSGTTSVTVGSTTPDYDATVLATSPSVSWKLDGTGTTQPDTSGNTQQDGVLVGGATPSSSDDRGGSNAVSLDGSSGYVASTTAQSAGSSFSTSAWFKTSTIIGGDITGFAPDSTGTDAGGGRVVWMDNDGQLVFGVNVAPPTIVVGSTTRPPPPTNVVRSAKQYNDGHWHHVVTTYDGSNMAMYVDGVSVGTSVATEYPVPTSGYWRAGYMNLDTFNQIFGLNLSGFTSPKSYYLNGSVDDVAFYNTALSATQATSLWTANAGNAP